MHKRFAQLIALILVMTAALNAQCFANCAIKSVAQPPDHACCPHHKTTHADTVQAQSVPPALAFEITPQLAPTPVTTEADFPASALLTPPNRPSLTTALRL